MFNLTKKIMSIVKVVELIGVSESSIEDALQNVVKEASQTMRNIDSVNVKNIKVHVKDGQIASYGVNCKVSFRVERL
ncbi:MAG TPA: dodecin family protein [Lunatimonas sp.]|nr:dodecin family protein [Lunatimonas sp.]